MSRADIRTFIVDSFTDKPFQGNPAGVCLCDRPLDERRMQLIAHELNLSETAFVMNDERRQYFSIRFFSPIMEIPLCGHATLAAAKILFDSGEPGPLTFKTIGKLELEVGKTESQIEMQFPVYELAPATVSELTLAALGIESVRFCGYNQETRILMLEIADADALAGLSPNFAALKESRDEINGVLVTAVAPDDGYDFHSRYFWPWSGSNEDPVTGGTHTFMAKYWSRKLGKTKMKSFQSSARTGTMDVEIISDDNLLIRGNAVVVLEGNLKV